MTNALAREGGRKLGIRGWVRRGFLLWAVISTLWLANTMRTRGVPDEVLRSSPAVSIVDGPGTLAFLPAANQRAGLIFICGSGVSAHAYAPLLRPVADAGHAVFVIKLPYRFAPFESHREEAISRARAVIGAHPKIAHWVIAGHSLGGALAARVVESAPADIDAMVLIATTHPKRSDLSSLTIPVTKVYASNDGVAPPDRMFANKHLLPAHTKWVEIKGGNHSQFGHYGHQVMDGAATISRSQQQSLARSALLDALTSVAAGRRQSSRRDGGVPLRDRDRVTA